MDRRELLIQGLDLLRETQRSCGSCSGLVGKIIQVLDQLWTYQEKQAMESDIAATIKLITLRDQLFRSVVTAETMKESEMSAVKIVRLIVWWLVCEILKNSRAGEGSEELLRALNVGETASQ